MKNKSLGTTEADIFLRVFNLGQNEMTEEVAQTVLRFQFSGTDKERMHELALKNQAGKLTSAEQEELENYCRVGSVLDYLSSRARLTLKRRGKKA